MTQASSSVSRSGRALSSVVQINDNKSVVNMNLISILQDIQTKYGYVPEVKMREIAHSLGISLVDVYGVVTFYKSFSTTPRGHHVVTVCLGTACHVRGSQKVLQNVSESLGIEPGGTTTDREFSLETVNCLGCCALGPMVVVDGEHHGLMTSAKVRSLFRNYNNTKTVSRKTDLELKQIPTSRKVR